MAGTRVSPRRDWRCRGSVPRGGGNVPEVGLEERVASDERFAFDTRSLFSGLHGPAADHPAGHLAAHAQRRQIRIKGVELELNRRRAGRASTWREAMAGSMRSTPELDEAANSMASPRQQIRRFAREHVLVHGRLRAVADPARWRGAPATPGRTMSMTDATNAPLLLQDAMACSAHCRCVRRVRTKLGASGVERR